MSVSEPEAKRQKPIVDLTGDDDDEPVASVTTTAPAGTAAPAPAATPTATPIPIREVTLPGGVLDDSLLREVDAIVQQSNCVGCDGRGLAEAVAKKFPGWGCSYAGRRRMPPGNKFAITEDRAVPGTIDVRRGPPGSGTPLVINAFAQYEMGGPGKYKRVPFPPGVNDLAPQREGWFAQCLEAIGQLPSKPRSVAFPYQIGCGLAGGNWTRYRRMIDDFSRANPDVSVVIATMAGGAPGGGGRGKGGGRGAGNGGRGACFRCGDPGHWANACPRR